MGILVIIISLIFFVYWIRQFCEVIRAGDSDFPGRNDKLMWAIIIFFGSLPGALLYSYWKWSHATAHATDIELYREMEKIREQQSKQ